MNTRIFTHIKRCLLLWFKFFKTMILLLSGFRDFSVRFREIILESNRIQSANCHWWHFFPTVAYFGNQRQTNRGWVSKFQEYANCFDYTFVIPRAHVSALLSLTVLYSYFSRQTAVCYSFFSWRLPTSRALMFVADLFFILAHATPLRGRAIH